MKAAKIGIRKIEAGEKGGYFEFSQDANINPAILVNLLQTQPQYYRMEGPTKLKIFLTDSDRQKRIKFVNDLVDQLSQAA